ncbi:AraC family transcriptional regulator [Clostridium zeae]|uniref:AraC family transcriptional regulator n=1 Tax=Clostridium zeae TaxID=2759022 RepID=A0ABQ1E441_9CLOT|nr:Ada metal-binding domain-containing protein [Clostridium zeae]GFZ29510.1 AraC family transcriptional regulator [Clostridium zeae]
MKLTDKDKWNIIISCDSSYDGIFYYGVLSTKIYCKPSCKSKKPLQKNVVFFDSSDEAATYELRPCKRCRPDLIDFNPLDDILENAKNIYDTYFFNKEKLNLEIRSLGISQNQLIQLFNEKYSMTPIEYVNKLRIEKAKQLLLNSCAKDENLIISDIAMKCGFGSISTFYHFFKRYVKESPKEYRNRAVANYKK